uniref:tetraspanin-18-like n=1 Tax=Doryrhamphus excisus TaxID=161450 RepID=UPI0025AEBD43|nr:tetraspanin-18-like [Doryrhamphus excisus]XP_057943325.1 tetraspanin-18-like [Doryrhamphus excisus]
MGDCVNCIRRLLMICSSLMALLGILLIIVTVWIFLENDEIGKVVMVNSTVRSSVSCGLFLGIVLFLVGLVGCFGALRQKQFLLSLFFMAIIVIYVMQLLGLLLFFVNRTKLQKEAFKAQMYAAYSGASSEASSAEENPAAQKTSDSDSNPTPLSHWDGLMLAFKCCGVFGPEDVKTGNLSEVPKQCCEELADDVKTNCQDGNLVDIVFPSTIVGCYDKVLSDYEAYPYWIGAMVILLLTIELLAMFLAVMLYREL